MNGVCGASRLLGVYHLWPQIIPIPSTELVELRTEDEYVVMATDSLWKYITYDQIVHEAKSISNPIQVAKRLRDLAVAHGCRMDVSVIVVKLNIDRDPSVRSLTKLQSPESVLEPEFGEEGEDEEEPIVTNIDDAISDEEEKAEKEGGDRILLPALVMESTTQESIDRMVLNAIGSPLTESQMEDQPMMQSTNFDDLPLTDDSPATTLTSRGTNSVTSHLLKKGVTASSSADGKQAAHLYKQQQQLQKQLEMEYEAQTIPKIASQARKSSGFTDLDTSFEQTQVKLFG